MFFLASSTYFGPVGINNHMAGPPLASPGGVATVRPFCCFVILMWALNHSRLERAIDRPEARGSRDGGEIGTAPSSRRIAFTIPIFATSCIRLFPSSPKQSSSRRPSESQGYPSAPPRCQLILATALLQSCEIPRHTHTDSSSSSKDQGRNP